MSTHARGVIAVLWLSSVFAWGGAVALRCTPAPAPAPPAADAGEVDAAPATPANACVALCAVGCARYCEPACADAIARVIVDRTVDVDLACAVRATSPAEARACAGVRCDVGTPRASVAVDAAARETP